MNAVSVLLRLYWHVFPTWSLGFIFECGLKSGVRHSFLLVGWFAFFAVWVLMWGGWFRVPFVVSWVDSGTRSEFFMLGFLVLFPTRQVWGRSSAHCQLLSAHEAGSWSCR